MVTPQQHAQKPDASRQLALNLDSDVTIQTKRRCFSSMRSTIEDGRNKCKVMTNMWLLAQMRQAGRPL